MLRLIWHPMLKTASKFAWLELIKAINSKSCKSECFEICALCGGHTYLYILECSYLLSCVNPDPPIPRVHSSLHLRLTDKIAPATSTCALEFASFVSSLCWAPLAKPVFPVSLSLVYLPISTYWSMLTHSLCLGNTYPLPFWVTV